MPKISSLSLTVFPIVSSDTPRIKHGHASKNSDMLSLEERRLGRGIQQIEGRLPDCFGLEMLAVELALHLPECMHEQCIDQGGCLILSQFIIL